MSFQQPPVPEPLQPISRRQLWLCLLLPTIITVIASLIMPLGGMDGYVYSLVLLPLLAGPIAGFICTPWFVHLITPRLRGRSLVLTSIGYALGQLILTPIVGFGGCILVALALE